MNDKNNNGMDTKQTKNIWIGLIVIALILGAYYFGAISNNPIQTSQSTTTTPITTQEQATPNQITPQVTNIDSQKLLQTNKQTTVVTNSQACLVIANEAAQNEAVKTDGAQEYAVLQAHFKQSTGNCYYELKDTVNNPTAPSVTIGINYAPNDENIAFCTTNTTGSTSFPNGSFCYQNGLGTISESTFHLIEAQYLED